MLKRYNNINNMQISSIFISGLFKDKIPCTPRQRFGNILKSECADTACE